MSGHTSPNGYRIGAHEKPKPGDGALVREDEVGHMTMSSRCSAKINLNDDTLKIRINKMSQAGCGALFAQSVHQSGGLFQAVANIRIVQMQAKLPSQDVVQPGAEDWLKCWPEDCVG
jgi:hypothetical protein